MCDGWINRNHVSSTCIYKLVRYTYYSFSSHQHCNCRYNNGNEWEYGFDFYDDDDDDVEQDEYNRDQLSNSCNGCSFIKLGT